jgi:hypothetical protein
MLPAANRTGFTVELRDPPWTFLLLRRQAVDDRDDVLMIARLTIIVCICYDNCSQTGQVVLDDSKV